MKYLLLYLVWCLPTFVVSQNRYYVTSNATGANNGASWLDAFANLQSALQTAEAGDTVWVAEGTYYPADTANRFVSFEPKSGVRLYGGFSGSETSLNERDWQAHPTILSGNIGAINDSTDNSLNVMYLHHPDSFTVIDGFIFRDGVANFTGGITSSRHRNKCGGGMYIEGKDWEAYPKISNCIFIHNSARNFGGGVMINGEGLGSIAPKFYNCRFENNLCLSNGGGMAWLGGAWLEREKDIENCIFKSNISQRGGGFYFVDSEKIDVLELSKCGFLSNKALQVGGALEMAIGRIDGGSFNIDSSSFIENSALLNNEIALFSPTSSGKIKTGGLYNCNFISNFRPAPFSPNHFAISSTLTGNNNAGVYLFNNQFLQNYSESILFSMDLTYGELILNNNLFFNNTVGTLLSLGGDFIVLENNRFEFDLLINSIIAVGTDYSNVLVLNNIFLNENSELNFFSIYGDTLLVINSNFENNELSSSNTNTNRTLIYNSLFTPNFQTVISYNSSPTTISHSYIPGLDCSTLPPNVNCGPGIITSGDPLFINPDSNDYRLLPCSPLRDAGTNAAVPPWLLTDLDGRPRILGGTVDIGAYEIPDFAATAAPTVQGTCTDATNGSVAFETEGGCPPFTYLWQPGNGGGTSATGLAPGTYAFTVTDAGGRSFLDTVAVPELPDPEIRADSMPISCYGQSDALLAVAPFSGPEPFTFLWSGGVTDSIFGPVGPGAWSVTATDANGCFTTYTYYLTAPDSLQFSAVVQDASGPVVPDGSVTVTAVLGGTGPYGYLWSDGSIGPVLDNVPPGTYTVTITDTRGCTAVSTYEVSFTIGTASPGETIAFSLFPNPAEHTVWLELGGSGTYLLEMYDASGRRVLQRNIASGRQQVILEGLSAGTYLAVVKNGRGEAVGSGRLLVN